MFMLSHHLHVVFHSIMFQDHIDLITLSGRRHMTSIPVEASQVNPGQWYNHSGNALNMLLQPTFEEPSLCRQRLDAYRTRTRPASFHADRVEFGKNW